MTPHLEAPRDTGVDAAISEMRDNVEVWLDGGPFTFWEDTESVVAAVRAQMDDDIRRLVEAAQRLITKHEDFLMAVHECDRQTVAEKIDLPTSTAADLRAALEPFKATTVEEGRDA